MFDHVSIGVRDIARAKRFYDAALAPLGYSCLRDSPTLLGYGGGEVALWISPTESPVPADPNSGLHFCFLAPHETAVQAFHAAALHAGGEDNGGPGIRLDLPDLFDDGIERRRHRLVHRHRLMTFHEVRSPAVAAQQLLQFFAGNARENGWIGDFVAVKVQDGKYRSVARRIQELVGMP